MKTGLLLYLVLSLSLTSASAQAVLPGRDSVGLTGKLQDIIRQSRIPLDPIRNPRPGERKPILLPLSVLQSPHALKAFLQPGTNKTSSPLLDPGVCKDSSGNKLIGLQNQQIYLFSTTHTKDDGVLMVGTLTDTTILSRGLVYNAFLLKADNQGNVLWIKGFGDDAHEAYSETEFNLVTELQSGDIMITGRCFNTNSKQIGSELIARYNAAGTLIWTKTYSSLIAVNASISPVDFRSVTDGLNGDIILCGTVMDNAGSNLILTTVRMTGDGNVVWDVNHRHSGGDLGTEGLGARMIGGQVLTVGLDHGSSLLKTPAAVEMLALNYADGSLTNRRLFATNYSDSLSFLTKQFTYFYNHVAFQDDGHFIVYGALYSDLAQVTPLVDHFGVMEFDAGFNLVNAYSVGTYLQNTSPAAVIHFDSKGRGIFLVERNLAGASETFLGVLQNHQLASQRYKIYNNALLSNSGGFGENVRTISFNDGSFVLSQNLSQFGNVGLGGSFINFKKMHLSDTSSSCIGIDTLFSQVRPLNVLDVTGSNDYPNEVLINKLTPTTFNLGSQPAPSAVSTNGCTQTNYCDTLKIHGDTVFCSGEGPQRFTAFKNLACGAIVQWQLDSNFVAADSVLSDSSVQVRFKKVSGVTKIRAMLPAGTCTMRVLDSLVIRIVASPDAPDFGPDTTLCGGNTILLNTATGFVSYLWQDGSTGHSFLVSKPGRYFVAVVDACGNTLRDTIDITDAQTSFSAGNDTVKCNGDSVRLIASRGYERYTWSPAYNLDSINARATPAYPAISTTYTVQAERGTNCVVTKSVRVDVLRSNTIDFGGDTTLCMGASLLLDAGPGFSTYRWSNGSPEQTISASAAGRYSVSATAANGCVSQAGLTVLSIKPAPLFSLASAADTTICDGQRVQYHFSLPSAIYSWSDGSSSSDKSISTPGAYSLTVSADGCAVTRSVNVLVNPTPPVNLGSDLFLCPGDSKTLDAVSDPGVSWKWQDGSTGSQFLVTRTGLYHVSVTLDGCTRSDSVMVTYLDKPKIHFPKDTMICAGQTMLLNPGLNTQADYLWQDGSTSAAFSTQTTGLYSVSTSNICGSDEASVQVIPGICQILLPNAFTPNRDGKNDVFRIRYFFPTRAFKMKIYNRSGQLMFESADMTGGWDGTLHGLDQPQGGYTWFVEMTSLTGEKSTARGVLLLLR